MIKQLIVDQVAVESFKVTLRARIVSSVETRTIMSRVDTRTMLLTHRPFPPCMINHIDKKELGVPDCDVKCHIFIH